MGMTTNRFICCMLCKCKRRINGEGHRGVLTQKNPNEGGQKTASGCESTNTLYVIIAQSERQPVQPKIITLSTKIAYSK